MSSLAQFGGGNRVPKAIINGWSTTGTTPGVIVIVQNPPALKVVTTGALTANTLTTVLSLTGSGVVNFLAAGSQDVTSRTHRMKVTIDGTVVFDSTSAAVTVIGQGLAVIGSCVSASSNPVLDQIPFNSSFLVEYASSVSETGKTLIGYLYRTN